MGNACGVRALKERAANANSAAEAAEQLSIDEHSRNADRVAAVAQTSTMRNINSKENPFTAALLRVGTLEDAMSRDLVLEAIGEDATSLRFAAPRLRADRAVVLAAVHCDGYALGYASDVLRGDTLVCEVACASYGASLQFCSGTMRDNFQVVMSAVKQSGHALRYASVSLRDNHQVVLAACTAYGFALQHASPRLQDEQGIVEAAVCHNGYALQFASSRCRDNFELVLKAVASKRGALSFASSRLRRNAFHSAVQERLLLHRSFLLVVLAASTGGRGRGCELGVFAGHLGTILPFIGEHAGVARGEELRELRAGADGHTVP